VSVNRGPLISTGRIAHWVLVIVLVTGTVPTVISATGATQDSSSGSVAALVNAGRFRQATEVVEAALGHSPNDASLHYWLGRCFYELHDYSKAASSLDRAVSLAPNDSEYHDWLGKALGRRAEEGSPMNPFSGLSLARKTHHEFETAVHLAPTNLEAQRDLIRYLINAPGIVGGGEDRAAEQIKALSAIDPIEGELAQAEYLSTRKKFQQASEEYQKVISQQPQHIGIYFEIAEYYRDRGEGELMDRAIEAGSKLAPFDPRLGYYRGVAWVLMKKDLGGAEINLTTYLNTVPDSSQAPPHVSAYDWLGKAYEEDAKPDLAVEQYRHALLIDPHDKTAHDALKRLQKT